MLVDVCCGVLRHFQMLLAQCVKRWSTDQLDCFEQDKLWFTMKWFGGKIKNRWWLRMVWTWKSFVFILGCWLVHALSLSGSCQGLYVELSGWPSRVQTRKHYSCYWNYSANTGCVLRLWLVSMQNSRKFMSLQTVKCKDNVDLYDLLVCLNKSANCQAKNSLI